MAAAITLPSTISCCIVLGGIACLYSSFCSSVVHKTKVFFLFDKEPCVPFGITLFGWYFTIVSVYHCKYIYIYLVNSHENCTILRQRHHEGSKLKNCFIAIWVFGM